MKKVLLLLPNLHNWISDQDFIWWPFSFLRPAKNVSMTFQDVLMMTGCFGGLAFLMFTVFYVMNGLLTLDSLVQTFFACFGGFGIWFLLITKPLWNIRARELQKK